jgi:hypothetical protein
MIRMSAARHEWANSAPRPHRDGRSVFHHRRRALYRFAHTIVTRRVVERGLLPQRAPFSRRIRGYALNAPLQ